MRGSASLRLLGLTALILVACSNDLGADDGAANIGASHVIAASGAAVTRLTTDDKTLVWFDNVGNVVACDLPECSSPRLLFNGGGFPSGAVNGQPHAAFIIGDTLFFDREKSSSSLNNGSSSSASLRLATRTMWSCPLAGCPSGATEIKTLGEFTRVKHEGTSLVVASSKDILTCDAKDCAKARSLLPREEAAPGTTTCRSNSDCKSDAPICSGNGTCVECTASSYTCSGSRPYCDSARAKCVECLAGSYACSSGAVCSDGVCKACDGNFGSSSSARCNGNAPFCKGGVCGACSVHNEYGDGGVVTVDDCASAGMICDPSSGACGVACGVTGACPSGTTCSNNVCIPLGANGESCSFGAQCLSGACDDGTCGARNASYCTSDVQCLSGKCSSDSYCGVAVGGTCTSTTECRSGSCVGGKCDSTSSSDYPGSTPAPTYQELYGIAVANGRVFYGFGSVSSYSLLAGSVVSCPIASCPDNRTTHKAQLPSTYFSSSSSSSNANLTVLLDAGDDILFANLGSSAGIGYCTLPDCASFTSLTTSNYSTPSFSLESESEVSKGELFVNSGSSNYYDANLRCTRTSCVSRPIDATVPDRFGPSASTTRPFAVGATSIYWATAAIDDQPGSLIVVTARE